jgi:hypothetical protein
MNRVSLHGGGDQGRQAGRPQAVLSVFSPKGSLESVWGTES